MNVHPITARPIAVSSPALSLSARNPAGTGVKTGIISDLCSRFAQSIIEEYGLWGSYAFDMAALVFLQNFSSDNPVAKTHEVNNEVRLIVRLLYIWHENQRTNNRFLLDNPRYVTNLKLNIEQNLVQLKQREGSAYRELMRLYQSADHASSAGQCRALLAREPQALSAVPARSAGATLLQPQIFAQRQVQKTHLFSNRQLFYQQNQKQLMQAYIDNLYSGQTVRHLTTALRELSLPVEAAEQPTEISFGRACMTFFYGDQMTRPAAGEKTAAASAFPGLGEIRAFELKKLLLYNAFEKHIHNRTSYQTDSRTDNFVENRADSRRFHATQSRSDTRSESTGNNSTLNITESSADNHTTNYNDNRRDYHSDNQPENHTDIRNITLQQLHADTHNTTLQESYTNTDSHVSIDNSIDHHVDYSISHPGSGPDGYRTVDPSLSSSQDETGGYGGALTLTDAERQFVSTVLSMDRSTAITDIAVRYVDRDTTVMKFLRESPASADGLVVQPSDGTLYEPLLGGGERVLQYLSKVEGMPVGEMKSFLPGTLSPVLLTRLLQNALPRIRFSSQQEAAAPISGDNNPLTQMSVSPVINNTESTQNVTQTDLRFVSIPSDARTQTLVSRVVRSTVRLLRLFERRKPVSSQTPLSALPSDSVMDGLISSTAIAEPDRQTAADATAQARLYPVSLEHRLFVEQWGQQADPSGSAGRIPLPSGETIQQAPFLVMPREWSLLLTYTRLSGQTNRYGQPQTGNTSQRMPYWVAPVYRSLVLPLARLLGHSAARPRANKAADETAPLKPSDGNMLRRLQHAMSDEPHTTSQDIEAALTTDLTDLSLPQGSRELFSLIANELPKFRNINPANMVTLIHLNKVLTVNESSSKKSLPRNPHNQRQLPKTAFAAFTRLLAFRRANISDITNGSQRNAIDSLNPQQQILYNNSIDRYYSNIEKDILALANTQAAQSSRPPKEEAAYPLTDRQIVLKAESQGNRGESSAPNQPNAAELRGKLRERYGNLIDYNENITIEQHTDSPGDTLLSTGHGASESSAVSRQTIQRLSRQMEEQARTMEQLHQENANLKESALSKADVREITSSIMKQVKQQIRFDSLRIGLK